MSKYKNEQCEYNGIKFDSEVERDYYEYLLTLYPEDRIVLQPSYTLIEAFVNVECEKIRPTVYRADFAILGSCDLQSEVIDVKGFMTPDFKIKKKLFEYIYKKKLTLVTRCPKFYGGGFIEIKKLKKLQKENPSPRAIAMKEKRKLKK